MPALHPKIDLLSLNICACLFLEEAAEVPVDETIPFKSCCSSQTAAKIPVHPNRNVIIGYDVAMWAGIDVSDVIKATDTVVSRTFSNNTKSDLHRQNTWHIFQCSNLVYGSQRPTGETRVNIGSPVNQK